MIAGQVPARLAVTGGASGQSLTAMEIVVALSAVALTISVVGLTALMRFRRAISGDTTFKLIGLAMTLGSSLFLIGAGYGQEQIAPVMSFLGTALGFIFGREMGSPRRVEPEDRPTVPPVPPPTPTLPQQSPTG